MEIDPESFERDTYAIRVKYDRKVYHAYNNLRLSTITLFSMLLIKNSFLIRI